MSRSPVAIYLAENRTHPTVTIETPPGRHLHDHVIHTQLRDESRKRPRAGSRRNSRQIHDRLEQRQGDGARAGDVTVTLTFVNNSQTESFVRNAKR